jgi:hypothetical protein
MEVEICESDTLRAGVLWLQPNPKLTGSARYAVRPTTSAQHPVAPGAWPPVLVRDGEDLDDRLSHLIRQL